MIKELLLVNLSLFDGEGGATGDSGTASAAGEQTGEETTSAAGSTDEGISTTSNTLEDRRKAFNDIINSEEYKQFYTEETQKMINRRFKETKNLEKQIESHQPLIDILSQRYNIQDGNIDSIVKAIEDDNSYWETAADEAGMTVEQYKRIQKLERENKALIQRQEMQRQNAMVDAQMNKWMAEADALKQEFPGFDFQTELQNTDFQRMITSGVPIGQAFKVLHMNEIMDSAVKTTAEQTQKKVVNDIRARGSRPVENGLSSQNAISVKGDVTKLTKQQREELAIRAMRGERISFT